VVIIGLLRDDPIKLNEVKPVMRDLIQDKSWRVRYMAAAKIVEVFKINLLNLFYIIDSSSVWKQNSN
jgi:hypothetical protein